MPIKDEVGPTEEAEEPFTPAEVDSPAFEKAARRSGIRTVRKVVPYLWPQDHAWVNRRVVGARAVLVLAKFVTVATPDGLQGGSGCAGR